MITLKDIAKRCDVSPSTVSNILNGKTNVSEATKNKVLDAIKESGYQPNYFAQGMRKQKTNIIGIIVEEIDNFSSPGVIEGIMAYCENKGYRTILENMRMYDRWRNAWWEENVKEYHDILKLAMREMSSIKVDGIIYVAGHARVIDCFPEDFEAPAVMAYGYSGSKKYPSVVIDDEKGSYDMTKYLISMGHRKIGVICGCPDNIHSQKRCLGYQKALFGEKILYNPELIRYGDWYRKSASIETENLIREGVTAIFCFNDQMAGGVYDYLEDHQMKAGKDIAVVGYDNQEFTNYFRPQITTMEIAVREIGNKAAEILLDIIDDKYDWDINPKNEIEIPGRLIERASVNRIQPNLD